MKFAAKHGDLPSKVVISPGKVAIERIWLVVSTPLKNMKVNWADDISNIWKNKKCSKPPTRDVPNHDFEIFQELRAADSRYSRRADGDRLQHRLGLL